MLGLEDRNMMLTNSQETFHMISPTNVSGEPLTKSRDAFNVGAAELTALKEA